MAKSDISIERGARLRELRKKAGLSRVAFAGLTGTSANTLKSLELGDREMSPQKALLFSNLFSGLLFLSLGEDAPKASFEFLYHGKETEPSEKETVTDDYEDGRIQNEINGFAANSAYSVLKITDDLMSPFYNEGDVVAGRKVVNKSLFSIFQGHVCIIETLGGGSLLRRVIKSDKQKITSCILNTSAQGAHIVEEVEARSLAQAIWHWHLSELVHTSPTA